jgi:oxaloacetate decarboxylase alpha subunit/pyruvate carboxylase subunit B
MPGNIMNIKVKKGDRVEKGQVVLILEAMKMENDIVAESTGTVSKILVEVGSSVQAGAPLIEIV